MHHKKASSICNNCATTAILETTRKQTMSTQAPLARPDTATRRMARPRRKLILFLDSNENISNDPLSQILSHPDLGMIDVVQHQSGLPGPHTFIRGSCQIDGAWVTPDIDIERACFLPFYFGVGDHRGILMDIPQRAILGGDIYKVSRP